MDYENTMEKQFDEAVEQEDTQEYNDEQWRSHFVIEDDQTADWALQQIRKAEADKKYWKQWYDDLYQKVCNSADRTIENMKAILQTYFESVPHKVTKTQESYPLPSGKLVRKKRNPEYERDDEQILDWLHRSGKEHFVKTKESVDWSGLKPTLNILGDTASDEYGEIVPGLRVIEREDEFTVELKKDAPERKPLTADNFFDRD